MSREVPFFPADRLPSGVGIVLDNGICPVVVDKTEWEAFAAHAEQWNATVRLKKAAKVVKRKQDRGLLEGQTDG